MDNNYKTEIAKKIGVQPSALTVLDNYAPPVVVYFDEAYSIVNDELKKIKYPQPYVDEAKLLFRALLEKEV